MSKEDPEEEVFKHLDTTIRNTIVACISYAVVCVYYAFTCTQMPIKLYFSTTVILVFVGCVRLKHCTGQPDDCSNLFSLHGTRAYKLSLIIFIGLIMFGYLQTMPKQCA